MTSVRSLGLWLVACALALRLIVAPGFMPVATGQGLTISVCTGTGSVEMALPGHEAPAPDDKGCAFATLAQAAPPVAEAALVRPQALEARATPLSPRTAQPHLGVPAPPPPATGPPLLA